MSLARLGGGLLVGVCASSCFAVTDLDRFDKAELASGNFTDLRLTVRGMTSHVAETFEYRVVDASNVIQSRGFVVPLGGVSATIFAHNAVPKQNGPFRVDFYADHDGFPGYATGRDPAADHSWRLALDDAKLDEAGRTYVVVFDHNTSFTFLNEPALPREIGKPAMVRLRNMGSFAGKRVEVRVSDASSGRVVALYRVPSASAAEMDLAVPGMIETGVSYGIELYTDDGKDVPGSVRAFRLDRVADAGGIDAIFDPFSPEVSAVSNPASP